jgi:hypothetical protein
MWCSCSSTWSLASRSPMPNERSPMSLPRPSSSKVKKPPRWPVGLASRPMFALFANLNLHETASERERPRSRRRLGPQKLAWYWRKTEGTFDCQASLVFGRQRTAEGGKGTDVRPAGRVQSGEAASEQKQGEIDRKRSAISVSDQRLPIAVRHDRRWWARTIGKPLYKPGLQSEGEGQRDTGYRRSSCGR